MWQQSDCDDEMELFSILIEVGKAIVILQSFSKQAPGIFHLL